MFETRVSLRATEKLPGRQKRHAQIVVCSYDMFYCELRHKKVEYFIKVSHLGLRKYSQLHMSVKNDH